MTEPEGRDPRRPLAFLVRDLGSGGVQRSQMRLAGAIAQRGAAVDLVVCSARLTGTGGAAARSGRQPWRGAKLLARALPFLADPSGVAHLAPPLLTKLRPSPTMPYLPALAGYLRRERPPGWSRGPPISTSSPSGRDGSPAGARGWC